MSNIDPAFLRGLTRPRLARANPARRDVLRMMGVAGAGLALSACGVKGQGGKEKVGQSDVHRYWAGRTGNGKLSWANWPGYMQDGRETIKAFEKETGIRVTYKEVIQEMGPWSGKIQAPLAAGQSIGFDLVVMTNGIHLERCRRSGYLVPLDHSKLENFAANAGPALKDPPYDPGNAFTIPYESGVTGIAYSTRYVKEEIKSIAQLFDPKYRGKVGMMADSQELGNFGMFLLGADPEKPTRADWEKAADRLREQRDRGVVCRYLGRADAVEEDPRTGVPGRGVVGAVAAPAGRVCGVLRPAPATRVSSRVRSRARRRSTPGRRSSSATVS